MHINRIISISTFITLLLSSSLPANAEQLQAMACNTATGDCYNSTLEIDLGQITIERPGLNKLILTVNDEDPENISAYDDENKVYYDIEPIPIGE